MYSEFESLLLKVDGSLGGRLVNLSSRAALIKLSSWVGRGSLKYGVQNPPIPP